MPRSLTTESTSKLRRKYKQYGSWAGVRWMRNQGVEFDAAYWVIFGCLPRR